MRSLRPLVINAKLIWYRWALKEICPLHPDVPYIVLSINQLEAERKAQ